MVVSAAIDKYIYLTVNRKYDGGVRVSYSQTENVERRHEVQHELVRACLQLANISRAIEITSVADIPAGSGLGSSSAFVVGLLKGLFAYQGEFHTAEDLARGACGVELELCHAPIGKQDQYAAAFGGLRCYTFNPDQSVGVEPIAISAETKASFGGKLLLLDTGVRRSANAILSTQQADLRDSRKRANVRSLANLAGAFRDALLLGRHNECGEILDTAWQLKRYMAGVSSDDIDLCYAVAKQQGAIGGKLCGAGAGGMMLFYAPFDRQDAIVRATGLKSIPFRLTDQGSTVIYAD